MEMQKTINCDIEFTGIALHSGRKVTVKLIPAPPNTGIIFRRVDLFGKPEIPATLENVINTTMCTELGIGKAKIKTVEHFLSAAFGLGVDNVIVEVDGCEMPAMDGSSFPFVKILLKAGIKDLKYPKKIIKLLKKIEIVKEDKKVIFNPSDRIKFSFFIDYNHPMIGKQNFDFEFTTENYISEISQARTFGFLEEVEFLKKNNLALGGSLENAIVLDKQGILNPEGLRFKDEFVRHKILDAIGDLSLIGFPIIGHFYGEKSGHELNNLLAKKILENKENWEFVEEDVIEKCAIA